LTALYPNSTLQFIPGGFRWQAYFQPMALSARYLVEIHFKLGEHPNIFVREPDLRELAPGKKIPHLYSQEDQTLCLYYPHGRRAWNATKAVANTIVVWATEWIIHFECWLSSDEWMGGGIHPTISRPYRLEG